MSDIFGGGAGPTDTPPAPHGPHDPGMIPEFGPAFVRFIVDRFGAMERLLARVLDHLAKRPNDVQRFARSGSTDNTGLLTQIIYESAPGQRFELHSLSVEADGYTYAVPFNGAGGMIELKMQDTTVDGASLVSGASGGTSLPCRFYYGRLQGIVVEDGERLTVKITSGPASKTITMWARGSLEYIGETKHG